MPEHVKVMPGVGHMKLAFSPEVYEHIRAWCTPGAAPTPGGAPASEVRA